MLRPAPLLAALAAVLGWAGGAEEARVHAIEMPASIVVTNEDGTWTIRTVCSTSRRLTVGPGYVSRLVSADGQVIVDDRRGRGTLNDPLFGGLGAFGWHHARGRPGRLRFHGRNAWEVSGRVCARRNGGFGVVRSFVSEPVIVDTDAVTFAIDVLFSDMFTYPRPLLQVRYRYRVEPSVVKSWIDVTPLCNRGRCGRTRALAFVKEPKLVAHVTGGGYTRASIFGEAGDLQCIYPGDGPSSGPILRTGQCGADSRTRVHFDFGSATSGPDGRCAGRPCLNVVMRAYRTGGDLGEPTTPWEGAGIGFDAWALQAARAPAAFRVDTRSNDGVVWGCNGRTPAHADQRRWEVTGRRERAGRMLALGGLFPAWEGGRGGYDCEPLARVFGPKGRSFAAFASYSIGSGWEELR
jgi:hypothetical protein